MGSTHPAAGLAAGVTAQRSARPPCARFREPEAKIQGCTAVLGLKPVTQAPCRASVFFKCKIKNVLDRRDLQRKMKECTHRRELLGRDGGADICCKGKRIASPQRDPAAGYRALCGLSLWRPLCGLQPPVQQAKGSGSEGTEHWGCQLSYKSASHSRLWAR